MTKRGKHKSVEASLDRRLRRLASNPLIKKIILGASDNARHKFSPGTLRIQREEPNGFKVNGYSGRGVTEMYVYCDEIHKQQVRDLISS